MAYKSHPAGILPFLAFYLAAALFLLPWHGSGVSRQDQEQTVDRKRIADYDIQVSLDSAAKTLTGTETISWLNADGPAVNEVKLHLYMNAFRSADTRFFEYRDGWSEEDAGWIDVKSVTLADGRDLTDKKVVDETVMTVPLPEPVEQGQKLLMEIEFEVQLPRIFARTGYAGDYFFVGQWFPKMGVFTDGRWVCPQFHSYTEFFSDFGRYRVEITVPTNFEVGATGIRERAKTQGGTKTLIYSAFPVHDFAWTASPDFQRVRESMKYTSDGEERDLDLNVLMQKDRMDQAPKYVEAVRRVLETFSKDYGPFPYPKLVVVDPGPGRGQNSGGMEYPMLITGGSNWLDTYLFPGGSEIVGVTTHEFGHQYWYGAVANNEFEEAWLDEGLNSFTSDKVIDSYGPFGRSRHFAKSLADTWITLHPFHWGFDYSFSSFSPLLELGFSETRFSSRRIVYLQQPSMDPITNKAYRPFGRLGYRVSAYNKPTLAMRTLEHLLGSETVTRILSRFYHEFRFRHPSGEDFRNLVSEVAGEPMDWFFSQVWDGSGTLDYAVTNISADSEVVVERLGEVVVPQRINVTLSDGNILKFNWDRKGLGEERIWMEDFEPLEGVEGVLYRMREGLNARWLKIAVKASAPVESAQVDPDYGYALDINFANNSFSVAADPGLSSRAELDWVRLLGRWLHGMSLYN